MATIKNTITMQDKMTPVLRTIIKSMQSTLDVMAGVDKVSNSAFRNMQKDVRAASDALDKFNNEIVEIPSQQEKVRKGFSGWQKAVILVNQGVSLLRNTVGRLGLFDFDKAFGRMDTMTNFNRSMTAIIGDSKAAEAVLDNLNTTVKGTAYGLDVAAKSAQNLITRDVGVAKSVKLVETWADAVAFYGKGTNEQLESVMDALGKMYSKGDVDMQQLDRLTDAGINVVGMYAKAVGESTGEVQKQLSKGIISTDQFISTVTKAMEEGADGVLKISGAAKEAGGTWATTIANMRAAGTRGLVNFIDNINKSLENAGLPNLMEMLVRIGKAAESGLSRAGQAIGNFISWITPIVQSITNFIKQNSDTIISAIKLVGVALGTYLTAKFLAAGGAALIAAGNFMAANWQLMLIVALAAAAVWAWHNLGEAGKVLAAIIGVVVAALIIWKVAQWAVNIAMYANPILLIVALIALLIIAIVAVVLWLMKLWKTNMDFKYGVLKIWNDILGFFDLVPIFFKMVGNGIADAFGQAKVKVLEILQGMANGAIDIINGLIETINKIPGVAIDTIEHLTFAATAAAEEEAKKQARRDSLRAAGDSAAEKAAKRELKLQYDRMADERKLAQQKAEAEAAKKAAEEYLNPIPEEFDWDQYMTAAGNPTIAGGNLDSIGKIKDDVSITDEDIKLLKDVAATEFVNKYMTLRPEMSISFGDVRETADVNKILSVIEDMVEEAYASSLVGAGA